MSTLRQAVLLISLMAVLAGAAPAQAQDSSSLEKEFKTPPDSAKPFVWWHWMNGNISKQGITADLEWMKRTGVGGMVMFDGSLNTPQFVERRLVWMTPEWRDAFRHAAAEANRLGLSMSMAASGGWSESGGPWVKPNQAMKKYVWSETTVRGPAHFAAPLPLPPTVNGPYQQLTHGKQSPPQIDDTLPEAKPMPVQSEPAPEPTFYADARVIAFRTHQPEVRMAELHPKVSSNITGVDVSRLIDGDITNPITIALHGQSAAPWIQFEFAQPYTARAFTVVGAGGGMWTTLAIARGRLESSADGNTWARVLTLPGPGHPFGSFPVRTYSFPPVTARFYRLTLDPGANNPAPEPAKLAELELSTAPRVNYWEAKAQFENILEYESARTPEIVRDAAIAPAEVVDLTARLRSDGTLEWDVPPGNWIVLRLGYSLTGHKNGPASPEATGYEADKLSGKHMEAYLREYVQQVSAAAGPYFGKSFRSFLMDSWEAGMENWTDDLLQQFESRRGYSAVPYLPVLTGRVVESADASDRFLWDFRRTLADLLAENHYGAAARYFKKFGVGLAAEAMGGSDPTSADGLQAKGQVDLPMGEFWTGASQQIDWPAGYTDLQEAASAAHIYGKPMAGAESFTTDGGVVPAWGQGPFFLKPLADRAFAYGINKFMIHTSVHQPFVDDSHKPGMTLGFYGQHYTRNITWAEQAADWNRYLARTSYLLQQGLYVADLAYYYGEGAPMTVPFWKMMQPAPPEGYSYDWANTEVLLTRMAVKDGRIVLPDGMSYRVLVVPQDVQRLTLPVVRKLRELVAAGASLVAPRPGNSPSLRDYPEGDAEIRMIANEMWGAIDGMSITENAYGKGRVYWGKPLREVLAALNSAPDVECNRPHPDSNVAWIHRSSGDAEIYFVSSQRPRAETFACSFRVEGRNAELWRSDSGSIEPAAYQIQGGRTEAPLALDPFGSVFVVFRGKAAAPSRVLPVIREKLLLSVKGPWTVTFPPNWGAPPQVRLEKLVSWTEHPDTGVKYFSGTATYSKDVAVPAWTKGERVWLDLGQVCEIAEVSINGHALPGSLWKPPYRVDVTEYLKPGASRLEVKLTNLWTNRMIGDLQPGAARRHTFTDYRPFTKDSPLLQSGLLGPVNLYVRVQPAETQR